MNIRQMHSKCLYDVRYKRGIFNRKCLYTGLAMHTTKVRVRG